MDTIKLLRTQGDLCKLSGAFDDGKLLYDAANTIEAYQKAFEDIKVEIRQKYIVAVHNNNKVGRNAYISCFEIIDKYDPDKEEEGDEWADKVIESTKDVHFTGSVIPREEVDELMKDGSHDNFDKAGKERE